MIGIRKPWLLGLAPVTAVLAAAGLAWNWLSLPEPSKADREGLVKWLVLAEISEQDADTQLALLDRMQIEFGSDSNLSAEQAGLSESLQARLDRNLIYVQRFWFFTRVEQLAQIKADAKDKFLDDQISFAEQWAVLTSANPDAPDVFDMIDQWLSSSVGKQKAVAQDGVRAGLQRFLQTRELVDYPKDLRLELANRIVEDLELGMSLGGVTKSSNDEDATKLRSNGMLLVEAWLTNESRQYVAMSMAKRAAYLDLRIKQIRKWGVLAIFSDGGGSPIAALTAFASKSNEWIKRSSDADRPGLQVLFRDVTQRLLFGGG